MHGKIAHSPLTTVLKMAALTGEECRSPTRQLLTSQLADADAARARLTFSSQDRDID